MSAVFSTDEEAAIQYTRLRRKVGATEDVIPDALAEELFVEAEERYPSNTAKMVVYARVLALQMIRADAAKLGKYAQNQSMTDLTAVFKNLTDMLREAETETSAISDVVAEEDRTSPFSFGVAPGRRGL